MKTALVISPHTDDAELGAGGTIARLLEDEWRVHVAVLSRCEDSLPEPYHRLTLARECYAALQTLGVAPQHVHDMHVPVRHFPEHRQDILETLYRLAQQIQPDRVFCPSPLDRHQDHSTTAHECMRAFRCSVWAYVLPWNTLDSRTRGFVRLEERHVTRKLEALSRYESQHELGRAYMCPETVKAWARTTGLQAGCLYAESFEILREIN